MRWEKNVIEPQVYEFNIDFSRKYISSKSWQIKKKKISECSSNLHRIMIYLLSNAQQINDRVVGFSCHRHHHHRICTFTLYICKCWQTRCLFLQKKGDREKRITYVKYGSRNETYILEIDKFQISKNKFHTFIRCVRKWCHEYLHSSSMSVFFNIFVCIILSFLFI